jgi:hypothetical protein
MTEQFTFGQSVTYQGRHWKVRQVKDGKVHIRPFRRAQWEAGWANVDPAELSPWVQPEAKPEAKTTCQCCGRQIEANIGGKIAHHGYRRPQAGSGWQTASCVGARYAPFQVSRDRLGWLIDEVIKVDIQATTDRRKALSVPDVKVPGPGVRRPKDDPLYGNRYAPQTTYPLIGSDHPRYSDFLADAIEATKITLKGLEQELEDQQKRYDSWKPVEIK